MEFKGIARGDSKFRHFTFNDDDVVVRNGVQYYKVNYGKNAIEGEYAEDEIGYVACDKVMTLGGRKPKQIKPISTEPKPEPVSKTKKEVKTKTSKKKSEVQITETNPDCDKFEYNVIELNSNDIDELRSNLNDQGNEGWEMCGFDTNKNLFGGIQIIAVFKRKRG